ncbi:IS66 family transposase [Nitrosomonas sp.]|uniref:IS66 family transposase n=1 Tax=Nitrosomonas sp. TaxID=42353 RepID=UPI00208BC1D0|nr:IS66 family transposase [Nitrosomonas sp.]GJL76838.1 MAG: hypothetical protein NMNS02_29440 [Nitrosomonas sp.]
MASIDKASVRQQIDGIKVEFKQLHTQGKITPEVHALMNSMLLIIDLILSIFQERLTRKTNKNASIPSSQMAGTDDTTPGSKSKGRQFHGATLSNRRTYETVTIARVETCSDCGEDLSKTTRSGLERRTRIDIVFEKVVEHIDAEIKQCPRCQHTTKGHFPADLYGRKQYGNGVKALVINLLLCQMIALNRAGQMVQSLIDETLSEATMLQFVLRLHETLADWEDRAITQLLQSPVMFVDETGLRVDRKNHWIHVYCAGDITLKRLHQKRGKEAIDAIHIIPRYGGIIVHDCWASYLSYDHCDHGLCGAHLLRELTFMVEANQYAWAKNMKKLLQKACHEVSQSDGKCLDNTAYKKLQKHYRNLLARGEKEMPVILPKAAGKRGKMAKSDAHNLLDRLRKYEAAVLLFAKNPHVAFTNNRSERDLRMAKVKQKVSGCFRSELYAQAYCRISSYLQTMANKGINPMLAIQMALAGQATVGSE